MTRPIDWTPTRRAALGTASDQIIADRLGIHVASVRRARVKFAIAACPHGTQWDAVADLGAAPDRMIAERLGVLARDVAAARTRRGIVRGHARRKTIAWDDVPELGVLPDSVVAWLYDADPSALRAARRRRFKLSGATDSIMVPATGSLLAALRKLHPRVPLHVAAFLVLAKATGAHDTDR